MKSVRSSYARRKIMIKDLEKFIRNAIRAVHYSEKSFNPLFAELIECASTAIFLSVFLMIRRDSELKKSNFCSLFIDRCLERARRPY